MSNTRSCIFISSVFAILCLVGCSASGPATTFYVLDADVNKSSEASNSELSSIGVGPVKLPGYLENTGIVSRKGGQVLNVSGAHAWAESLDQSIARLVAKTLSAELNHDEVWSFPWDLRNRPQTQIHITIEQLDGERGDFVTIRAKWFAFDISENTVTSTGDFNTTVQVPSTAYSDYVDRLAAVVAELAKDITKNL